jgi:O-antigen/teichoic acid export membrane protein
LWALVAVNILIMLRECLRRVSLARLKVKTAFLFDVCVAAGQIGGLLLLARSGVLSASRAYWVAGLACGIAVLGWLWSNRGSYRPQVGESFADVKKNWTFGKWVFASGLVWTVSMNLYPWFLAYFHGAASAGVWAACLGVVSVGNPALLGINNVLGPRIAHVYAERGAKSLRRFVVRAAAVVALPMSLLCLVMAFGGGRCVALLYGRQYAGNGLVVTILALNLAVSAIAFSFSRGLFAAERADLDFLVNFIAMFVMITLGLWLVRAFGPVGAAFALLGANFTTLGVRATAFLRLPVRMAGSRETA